MPALTRKEYQRESLDAIGRFCDVVREAKKGRGTFSVAAREREISMPCSRKISIVSRAP